MSRPQHRYVATRSAPRVATRKMGPRRWAYHQPVRPRSSLGTLLGRVIFVLLVLLLVGLLAGAGYQYWVQAQTSKLIYTYDAPGLPQHHVAMVFGAGLNASGGPSPILYDRVATAVDLYNKDKVNKLLMTGDNSTVNYNEVEVMRQAALKLGVPDKDIVLDYAGFSTWDSCYRAREVFSLADATLVTQRFHLPRALYTCNHLGVNSVGVAADRQSYDTFNNEVREFPALINNAFRMLTNEQPRFLGPKVDVDQPQEK